MKTARITSTFGVPVVKAVLVVLVALFALVAFLLTPGHQKWWRSLEF